MAKQKRFIGLCYVLFNICFLVSLTFAHYDQQQATHYSPKKSAPVNATSPGQSHRHQQLSPSSKTTVSSSTSRNSTNSSSSSRSYVSTRAAIPRQQTGRQTAPVKPPRPTPLPHKLKPAVPVKKKHVKPGPPPPPPPSRKHRSSVRTSRKPAPPFQPASPVKSSPVPAKLKRVSPRAPSTPAKPEHKPNPLATTPIPPATKTPAATPARHHRKPATPAPFIPQPTPPAPPLSSSSPLKPTTPTAAQQSSVDFKNSFEDIYVFGESSSDTGNGYSVGGIQPYVYATSGKPQNKTSVSFGLSGGDDYFGAKSGFSEGKKFYGSAAGSFGGGYRLTNGGLVVDYLVKTLGVKSPVPYTSISGGSAAAAAVQGGCINFAIAGASTLTADFFKSHKAGHAFMFKEISLTFQTQIDWFAQVVAEKIKKFGPQKCQQDIANTLFWVGGIGANDYARMFGSDVNGRFINEASVNLVSKLVKTLVKDGAQYILVQGLAPIGCTPSQLSLTPASDRDAFGCSTKVNAVIKAHNSLLQQKLQVFRELYPKSTIAYGDMYGAYLHILMNRTAFGFTEPFKACCGSPTSPAGKPYNFDAANLCGTDASSQCQDSTKYISWDGIHFTDAMNKHVAELLLKKGFCNPPFEEIIRKKKGLFY